MSEVWKHTSPTKGMSTVEATIQRHLEEELKMGQTQQSRVQRPVLQPRKEATGLGMSGMKHEFLQFSKAYQLRAGVDAIWTYRARMAGEVKGHHSVDLPLLQSGNPG